jgi:hypothetical protein
VNRAIRGGLQACGLQGFVARGGLAKLHGGRSRGVAGGRAMVVLLPCEDVSSWCVREGVGAGCTRFDADCE